MSYIARGARTWPGLYGAGARGGSTACIFNPRTPTVYVPNMTTLIFKL